MAPRGYNTTAPPCLPRPEMLALDVSGFEWSTWMMTSRILSASCVAPSCRYARYTAAQRSAAYGACRQPASPRELSSVHRRGVP